MGVWRKKKTGLSPTQKSRKKRSQGFYNESLADVAVSPHRRYAVLMVGKDAENFDPQEVMPKAMDFETWLKIGYENGWCGAPVCYTHDGLPTTEQEDETWIEGDDPCIHIIRLYEDEDQKRGIEENHSPSQWRASNRGL